MHRGWMCKAVGRATICALLLASNAAMAIAPKDIDGGKTYTSKTKRFTVVVPKARNWAVRRFHVDESSHPAIVGRPEEAVFRIDDFGEVYRIGVVDLGPEIRAHFGIPEGEAALEPKTYLEAALRIHFVARIPGEVRWTSIKELATPLGRGAVGICTVESGGALVAMSGAEMAEAVRTGKWTTPRPAAATVAVIAVIAGQRFVYASAQNDFENLNGTDPDAHGTAVAVPVSEMIASVKIANPPSR